MKLRCSSVSRNSARRAESGLRLQLNPPLRFDATHIVLACDRCRYGIDSAEDDTSDCGAFAVSADDAFGSIRPASWLGALMPTGLWNNRSLTIRAHDLSQLGAWASAREPLLVCHRDGSFVLLAGDGKTLATGLRRRECR